MLSFQRPIFACVLLLIPLYMVLKKYGLYTIPAFTLPLGNWKGRVPEKHTAVYILYHLSKYVLIISFCAVTAALTGPVYLTSEQVYAGSGQAVMFVIDTSPSIAAQDMGTDTRLEAAKKTIRIFMEKYSGDSFGLTAFGSTAAVLIPPTLDKETFLARLDTLSVGEFGEGTAIGMGLAAAVLHLTQINPVPAHIMLFTDGDNNTGSIHPRTAAEMIKRKSIGFYVIGLGKSGYAPVRYIDPIQKKEVSGTLHTVFDESELKSIAYYGSGSYFSAQSPELLTAAFQQLSQRIPVTQPAMIKQKTQQLDIFCVFAALFFAASAWTIRRLVMKAVIV